MNKAVVLMFAAAMCATAGLADAQTPAPDFSLRMKNQSAPIGSLCSYAVEIRGDGTVIIDVPNAMMALAQGRFTRHVDPARVAPLAALVDRADFFNLKDRYEWVRQPGDGIPELDEQTITVTRNGAAKTVSDRGGFHFGGRPEEIGQIETMVAQIADPCAIAMGSDKLLPALRQTDFDFTSRQAGAMLIRAMSRREAGPLIEALLAGHAPLDVELGREEGGPSNLYIASLGRGNWALYDQLMTAGMRIPSDPQLLDRALSAVAASSDRVDIARDLLRRGANPNAKFMDDTLIYNAVRSPAGNVPLSPGRAAVLKALIDAGADVNGRSRAYGFTPLMSVANGDVARMLLAAGADPNLHEFELRGNPRVPEPTGPTALLLTQSEGVALALIQAGADVNARGANNRTIDDIAKSRGWSWVSAAAQAKREAAALQKN